MKTNKFLAIALGAVLLVGCKDKVAEREPAAPETNAIQAYIYGNTSDISMKPAGGDSVFVTWGEGTFQSALKVFPVVIGRRITNVADSLPLVMDFDDEAFVCRKDYIKFEVGQACDTIWFLANLDYGKSDKLSISIPDQFSTAYGAKSQEIKVSVDYTWLSAGSVTMTSEFEGASGVVAIEKAKEFKNEQGDSLYRLVSPYYYLAPKYCTEEGYHLRFILDKEYKAVGLYDTLMIQLENTNYPYIFWSPEYVAPYGFEESFTSSYNQYSLKTLWASAAGSIMGYAFTESFVWDNGYPGKLVNPSEGDAVLDTILFTSGTYEMIYDDYGAPVTVDEVLDPIAYYAGDGEGKGVFEESYIPHYLYSVTLSGPQGEMVLELVGDSIDSEYSFVNYEEDNYGNLLGKAGTATPGIWNGESEEGCYLKTAMSKYFLTDGAIKITKEKTVIAATSANGAEINAVFNGELKDTMEPVAGRFAKNKRLINL